KGKSLYIQSSSMKTSIHNSIFTFLILMIPFTSSEKEFQKYELEKGIFTYSLHFPSTERSIQQKVYFSNYGAVEYFEFAKDENFPRTPILKIDHMEYVFTSDSMAVANDRGKDFIFEKLTKKKNSRLSNDGLSILKSTDTLILGKKCELITFNINSTGQKGKAALWKGIPLWVNSQWGKGIYENLTPIELDLSTDIPIEKRQLMDYIDIGDE
ncbi:MAG: hypothetical protein AAF696_12925, partial [Bacteroidota bacterium]